MEQPELQILGGRVFASKFQPKSQHKTTRLIQRYECKKCFKKFKNHHKLSKNYIQANHIDVLAISCYLLYLTSFMVKLDKCPNTLYPTDGNFAYCAIIIPCVPPLFLLNFLIFSVIIIFSLIARCHDRISKLWFAKGDLHYYAHVVRCMKIRDFRHIHGIHTFFIAAAISILCHDLRYCF